MNETHALPDPLSGCVHPVTALCSLSWGVSHCTQRPCAYAAWGPAACGSACLRPPYCKQTVPRVGAHFGVGLSGFVQQRVMITMMPHRLLLLFAHTTLSMHSGRCICSFLPWCAWGVVSPACCATHPRPRIDTHMQVNSNQLLHHFKRVYSRKPCVILAAEYLRIRRFNFLHTCSFIALYLAGLLLQVVIAGYNNTGGWWLVWSSWGEGWGDGGFARVSA